MDCDIIDILKSNEIEFCRSWSNKTITITDSFQILANRALKGDYFLNRVILFHGIEESKRGEELILSIVSQVKEISKVQEIYVYVHIDDNLSFTKSILEKNGLKKIDKLTGLVNVVRDQKYFSKNEYEKLEQVVDNESCKVVSSAEEFDDWLDIYSNSFGIDIQKRTTIRTSLQKENFRESKLILYEQELDDKKNNHNSLTTLGCCLLFPSNGVLGLYCLGTDKKFRNTGIASSIIDFAISYANTKGYDFLSLQALHSDNTTGFYQRRYFEKVYTKTIFSLPIS
ncbi:MAG: GNAT family N-acetyltransferase [Candidatus Nitrosocosmicus sp.]|nr:GNAT family N-acetyltransferase [Candidatus Nitrosocosmicus sp.]